MAAPAHAAAAGPRRRSQATLPSAMAITSSETAVVIVPSA